MNVALSVLRVGSATLGRVQRFFLLKLWFSAQFFLNGGLFVVRILFAGGGPGSGGGGGAVELGSGEWGGVLGVTESWVRFLIYK